MSWLVAGLAALALWPPAPSVVADPQDSGGLDITSASLVQQATDFELSVTIRQRWLPDYLDDGGPRSLCLVITQGSAFELCVTGRHAVLRRGRTVTQATVSADAHTLLAQFTPLDVGLRLAPFTWHVQTRWLKAGACAGGCADRTEERSAEATLLATPACFGADGRECANPALRGLVTPDPATAVITPNAPCTERKGTGDVLPCVFGAPPERARQTFALVGDSHAEHWRAALDVVAQAKHWRGISVIRTSCPFNRTPAKLDSAWLSDSCKRWNAAVREWFRRHPEVHTVFTSGHSRARFAGDAAAGFEAAWHGLPKTVTRIYVLRDTPTANEPEEACVGRALRTHSSWSRCTESRAAMLRTDQAAVAAAHSRDPRVKLLDLTRFLCDARVCPPVIGGVLVRKDGDHLTRLFSSTLGPFVLRALG